MTYKEALREIKYQEDLRGKGIDYRVNNLVVAKIVDSLEKQLSKPPRLRTRRLGVRKLSLPLL